MIKLLLDDRITGRISTRRKTVGQARYVSVHSFRFVFFWLRVFAKGFICHVTLVLFCS
jgi:hypothetical protein